MEGLDAPLAVDTRSAAAKAAPKRGLLYGYVAATLVAALAYSLHLLYKPASAAIIAILAGALLRNLFSFPKALLDGCKGLVRRVIPITIVLTGATLNLTDLAKGAPYLLVIVGAIITGTAAAVYCGRFFSASAKTALLVGAGTSICGTSAIVAVAPVIDAGDDDLLLSVSTINIYGLVVMLLLPVVGGVLHMSPEHFGVWAGTTVHAVPQAVTTGFAFGATAGALATLVKLVRVTLLAPFVLVMALTAGRRKEGVKVRLSNLLPSFIYGFGALAILNSLGLLPALTFHVLGGGVFSADSAKILAEAANSLLTLSMGAMGLEVNLTYLLRTGGPALKTGLAASVGQCLVTWALIRLLG
ncbi:MAG TPA: putative sulfate exporter family transporter [Bryobacteraceae bacterium]|nr:putative sulfate exporter family transporter [Bryobacteraceae bacterium]